MTHTEFKLEVLKSLHAAPKPLSADVALQLAQDALNRNGGGREAKDFAEWFSLHGKHLLHHMNNA